MTILLVCGVPGTGKSTFSSWLAREKAFLHLDVDAPGALEQAGLLGPWREMLLATGSHRPFLEALHDRACPVVLDWGFPPECLYRVRQLQNDGVILWWFDGDRPAALRQFLKRGTVPEELFYVQMEKIQRFKVLDKLKPHVVRSFREDGTIYSPEEIWLQHAQSARMLD